MSDQASNGILGIPEWGGARCRGNCRRGYQRSWGHGRGKAAPEKEEEHIPEDLVDPCKVFVSNLRPRVSPLCYVNIKKKIMQLPFPHVQGGI